MSITYIIMITKTTSTWIMAIIIIGILLGHAIVIVATSLSTASPTWRGIGEVRGLSHQ